MTQPHDDTLTDADVEALLCIARDKNAESGRYKRTPKRIMTIHPITLTPSQLAAALAGRLAQVRMPVEPQPIGEWLMPSVCQSSGDLFIGYGDFPTGHVCPFGVVGDRLYVQEHIYYSVEHDNFYYSCDGKGLGEENYLRLRDLEFDQKEAIDADLLPEWASRLTFDITGIRVERLQELRPCDVQKTGCPFAYSGFDPEDAPDWVGWYQAEWDAQHGRRHPWASNPWAWVLDVRKVVE